MRELFRTLPLMSAVLLIPVLPFLLFGNWFEGWVRSLAENPPSSIATATIVIALLATDILLPIPSSVISTLSGWQLGWLNGMLATWTGMNLGAIIGFALARRWGHPFAERFSKKEQLHQMQRINNRFGPSMLAITRAMPVFAEASVLIAGIHQLPWKRFLPAIVCSNFGIAIAYSAFGDFAERHQWLPFALGIAVAVPVLIAGAAQAILPRLQLEGEDSTNIVDRDKVSESP